MPDSGNVDMGGLRQDIRVNTAEADSQMRELRQDIRELRDAVLITNERLLAIPDHESRLRSLEKWRYALPTAAVMAVASFMGTVFTIVGK